MEVSNPSLTISKEDADDLYENAGKEIPEDCDQITLDKYEYIFSDSVNLILQEVLVKHPLPFKLMDFQLLTIHALGSLKNVILIAGTGMGKMICAYYGILVLQKVLQIEKGVGIGTLPISAIMEEKVKTGPVKTGLVTMSGELKNNVDATGESDADLSDSVELFKMVTLHCY